jgi:hypothetical protein
VLLEADTMRESVLSLAVPLRYPHFQVPVLVDDDLVNRAKIRGFVVA